MGPNIPGVKPYICIWDPIYQGRSPTYGPQYTCQYTCQYTRGEALHMGPNIPGVKPYICIWDPIYQGRSPTYGPQYTCQYTRGEALHMGPNIPGVKPYIWDYSTIKIYVLLPKPGHLGVYRFADQFDGGYIHQETYGYMPICIPVCDNNNKGVDLRPGHWIVPGQVLTGKNLPQYVYE